MAARVAVLLRCPHRVPEKLQAHLSTPRTGVIRWGLEFVEGAEMDLRLFYSRATIDTLTLYHIGIIA